MVIKEIDICASVSIFVSGMNSDVEFFMRMVQKWEDEGNGEKLIKFLEFSTGLPGNFFSFYILSSFSETLTLFLKGKKKNRYSE